MVKLLFCSVHTTVTFNNKSSVINFWILDNSPFSAILGSSALPALEVVLDFSCANRIEDFEARIHKSLPTKHKSQLVGLIKSFSDVFSKDDNDIGLCTLMKHSIDTGSERFIKSNQYYVLQALKLDAQKKVNELIKAGIIRTSQSPWSNPIIFVRKK